MANVTVRHGKTELLLHWIAWLLAQDPTTQIVYGSYAARLAEKKSRKARELARRAGVAIAEDASSRANWLTGASDGGLWACGVEGALTGEGADVAIVDDAHKDRASAESALQRQAIYEVVQPHVHDPVRARRERHRVRRPLARRRPVRSAHRSGLGEHRAAGARRRGRALWPSRFSAEQLQRIREERGEYTWAKLYQQRPRPRAAGSCSATFAATTRCRTGSTTIGVDLAYSQKETSADYSVATVLAHAEGVIYVEGAEPAFLRRLQGLKATHPGRDAGART